MKRDALLRIARSLAVVTLTIGGTACTWFTDFKEQPAIEPWEPVSQSHADTTTPPRGQPMYSIPIQGSLSPAIAISYTPAPVTLDSLGAIANPTPSDPASLDRGRKLYQINCAVCHGRGGDGAGTITKVNPAYRFSPSLIVDQTKARTDGYIYGMMRNGRGAMPSYARIEELERWDIVNYVRALQGGTADTARVGMPGQNGTTVPGPSFTAPTRPAPYFRATITTTPGSPGLNSGTFKGNNQPDNFRQLHGAPHAEKASAGDANKEKHE